MTNEEKLLSASADCDRAIVRATLKPPSAIDSEDVRFITRALANARDALRWAAPRTTQAPLKEGATDK